VFHVSHGRFLTVRSSLSLPLPKTGHARARTLPAARRFYSQLSPASHRFPTTTTTTTTCVTQPRLVQFSASTAEVAIQCHTCPWERYWRPLSRTTGVCQSDRHDQPGNRTSVSTYNGATAAECGCSSLANPGVRVRGDGKRRNKARQMTLI
jgi:hypothetical protein